MIPRKGGPLSTLLQVELEGLGVDTTPLCCGTQSALAPPQHKDSAIAPVFLNGPQSLAAVIPSLLSFSPQWQDEQGGGWGGGVDAPGQVASDAANDVGRVPFGKRPIVGEVVVPQCMHQLVPEGLVDPVLGDVVDVER